MQNTRKIISLVLAIVMLASVFTLTVSAGAPTPAGSAKVSISYELTDADGNVITAVKPGQVVYLNVYANAAVANDNLTGITNSVYFDESVYSYTNGSVEWLGVDGWVDPTVSSADLMNASTTFPNYTNQAKAWTDAEKAAHPGWTSFVYVIGTQNLAGSAYTVAENANSPMYRLKFTVKDTATSDMDADFGCPDSVLYVGRKSYNYMKTTNTGTIGTGEIDSTYGCVVTATILDDMSTQIRFDKNAGAYAGTFDIRTRAKIADAEWNKLFVSNDAAKTGITKVGFVYAPSTTAFNVDTAKEVAKGTAAAGYVDKEVNYIQDADGYYMFTCLVEDIADADKALGMTALAYIQVGDSWYFYDAETVVSYDSLYSTYYSQAFPA